jgi:hypothetical protein
MHTICQRNKVPIDLVRTKVLIQKTRSWYGKVLINLNVRDE